MKDNWRTICESPPPPGIVWIRLGSAVTLPGQAGSKITMLPRRFAASLADSGRLAA